jgi:hypothetical protein
MHRRTLTLTLLLALSLGAAPPVEAMNCACSCAAFAGFKARIMDFETELDRGASATMTPALQTDLVCLQGCAEEWMQCRLSDGPLAPLQTGTGEQLHQAADLQARRIETEPAPPRRH